MGAVQRHNFEIVRKGYDPQAVDDVILELTIAKNDAEALAAKLQKQAGTAPSSGGASTEAARIIADAKQQARQIVDDAHRQAESTLGGARAEAHRALTEARTSAMGVNGDGAPLEPDAIRKLLALAERFETQVTALAKGALADTASLARELEQGLAAAATRPAAPQPPAKAPAPKATASKRRAPAAIPEDEGDSTLDLLRKRSAGSRNGDASTNGSGDARVAETAEHDTRLAARVARETGRERPAAAQTTPDPLPEESTSLASRIAREQGSAASEEKQRDNERGSYYSRRSARLPRIGEEATAGAMAAVRSVRKGGEGAAPDDERTAQTA